MHAMPVELPDLEAAAAQYEQTLKEFCGSPAVLDLAHLAWGPMATPLRWSRAIRC